MRLDFLGFRGYDGGPTKPSFTAGLGMDAVGSTDGPYSNQDRVTATVPTTGLSHG